MTLRTNIWSGGPALALCGLSLGVLAASDEGALDPAARAGIEEALWDERQGEATYARVLEDHGEIRPFSRAAEAERRHAVLLEDLLTERGLSLPTRAAAEAEVPSYPSPREACAAAVAWEVRNVALYDRLLATPSLPDDVRRVFEHNRDASLQNHKPAFERCAGWSESASSASPGQRRRGRGGHHRRHGGGHHGGGCGGCAGCGADCGGSLGGPQPSVSRPGGCGW